MAAGSGPRNTRDPVYREAVRIGEDALRYHSPQTNAV